MSNRATIVVGSDICPVPSDESLFKSGDTRSLLRGFDELWGKADYRILNLECPLTARGKPISKVGPHLRASPECVQFLTASGTDAVCLANNHLRDYGDQGVLDTLEVCQKAGLGIVGGGVDLKAAREPLVARIKGLDIGIIAMAESEFSIAGPSTPGANLIDYRNFTSLRELTQRTDFVLVLVHGGTEMFQLPRPGLVDLCRFLVDQGAAAVIVQHTHCVGCHEIYLKAPIVYGQGNFIFGTRKRPVEKMDPKWFTGMLVELALEKGGRCEARFHPYEQSRGFAGIRPIEEDARARFFEALEQRSSVLANPEEHRRQWLEFCLQRRSNVLSRSLGIAGLAASINYRLPFAQLLQGPDGMRNRLNLITCESHRELLEACLRIELDRH